MNDDELVLAIGHVPPHLEKMESFSRSTKVQSRTSPSRTSPSKLEALDNLVISTIFSMSTKLCYSSGKLIRRMQEGTEDKEQLAYLDTLVSLQVM